MRNKKGFTLIELLVVIAIIGLLSTLSVVSLNSARAKARDAKRLSDIKNLQTSVSLAIIDGTNSDTTAFGGCTGADADTRTCTGITSVTWSTIADPSTAGTGTNFDSCVTADTDSCDYTISKNDGGAGALYGDYQICFRLEQSSNLGAAGVYEVNSTGGIVPGCN